MLIDIHARETEPLSGTWQAIPDPYGQFGADGPFGGHRIFDPAYRSGPRDADIDDGYDIPVPGCWNAELPGFERYEDPMWYARRFDWDERAPRAFVYFGAANYRADVWLNATHLGRHEGGFTPFAFEITDHLTAREDNLLVARVDASREERKLPTDATDWFTFGGLTRAVDLVPVPERFMRNMKVQVERDPDLSVTVTVWVDEPASATGASPQVELPELGCSWALERVDSWETSPHVGADETARGTVYEAPTTLPSAEVNLWRPDDPRRYELRVSLGDADELVEQIGLRTVTVDGSDVLVNGEPIELRGVSLHEEAEGRGRSLRPADRADRFAWLDELGCNFARLAHYPHHPAMARRADEAGILLWTEVPAYWFVDFGDAAVQTNYRQQLREVIQRDWNRASVIMWSIANETDREDEDRNEVLPEIAEYARSIDRSRLITAACFMGETDDGTLVVDDPLAAALDVVGLNEYRGWYHGDPEDLHRFADDPSGPPVIISEFGAGAKRGNHGSQDERWTEQHQAGVYRAQLAAIDSLDQCSGLSPWILFDYRSPRRQNPLQRGFNRKGLMDEGGNRKAAFDVLRRYYEHRS